MCKNYKMPIQNYKCCCRYQVDTMLMSLQNQHFRFDFTTPSRNRDCCSTEGVDRLPRFCSDYCFFNILKLFMSWTPRGICRLHTSRLWNLTTWWGERKSVTQGMARSARNTHGKSYCWRKDAKLFAADKCFTSKKTRMAKSRGTRWIWWLNDVLKNMKLNMKRITH